MRRNTAFYFIVLVTIVVLVACSNTSSTANSEYYASEDEAIENGLTEKDTILSVEKHQNSNLVFFEREENLGAAILTEKSGKYKFVRENPLFGFEGGGDYSTIVFVMKTEKGEEMEILTRRVFNMSVKKIVLEDEETKERVEIWNRISNDSKLFYYILGEKPLRVISIKE
ncbi:hypothetical protein [Alkaliphilus serpentinus]|uniref:Lipoprotein n=1 Tax=Alkaliphilus serpentinus TaxID=1482731 RepID=A0A833HNF3_9FIRM|nr:hypothetical protein [Alkaliphilus serpentinus]KAB3529396.1 hypothetical protein F8153_09180 [Alkaliphilus serpentinus]